MWNGKYTGGKEVKLIPEKILMNLHFWEMTELRKWFIKDNTKLITTYCVPHLFTTSSSCSLSLLWGCIMRTSPFSKLQEFFKKLQSLGQNTWPSAITIYILFIACYTVKGLLPANNARESKYFLFQNFPQ